MQAEYKPDMLQVSHRSNGALIAVGVPLDAGLLVQEYWSDSSPHYAVANLSDAAMEIAFVAWNGTEGRTLIEPWTLERQSVRCLNARDVLTGYSGTLVAVSLNANPVYGLLRAPTPLSSSIACDEVDGVLTVDGLNGIGDRNANIWCLQSKLIFESSETISVTLHIPDTIKTISFTNTPLSTSIIPFSVVEAASASLSVERKQDNFVIGGTRLQNVDVHAVQLNLQLPASVQTVMAALSGHVASSSGGGFSWARGLLLKK